MVKTFFGEISVNCKISAFFVTLIALKLLVTGPNNFKAVPPDLNLEKSGTKSTHALKPSLFFVLS